LIFYFQFGYFSAFTFSAAAKNRKSKI
jgi:hypothetical protein